MSARRFRSAAVAVVTATTFFPISGAVASPAETSRTVEHDVTLPTEFGEDEFCGLGTIAQTQFNRLQMQQLTENADGSFHFTDFETGTTTYDFVDAPQVADIVVRRTNTFHLSLTKGGTVTVSETLRESDGNLTVYYRYHLTEVHGQPVVERTVESISLATCPE